MFYVQMFRANLTFLSWAGGKSFPPPPSWIAPVLIEFVQASGLQSCNLDLKLENMKYKYHLQSANYIYNLISKYKNIQ